MGGRSSKMVQVGDAFPAIKLDDGFAGLGCPKVDMAERLAGKKSIVVPGYLAGQDQLKEAGIDEVLVFCVNDGACMSAWAKEMKVEGTMVKFLADTRKELTDALGMELKHPGPMADLGNPRCKRFAAYVDNGIIKVLNVAEKGPLGEEDPAGDDFPEVSCIDNMLKEIKAL
eukprot:PRCOL_00002341-RA